MSTDKKQIFYSHRLGADDGKKKPLCAKRWHSCKSCRGQKVFAEVRIGEYDGVFVDLYTLNPEGI